MIVDKYINTHMNQIAATLQCIKLFDCLYTSMNAEYETVKVNTRVIGLL